MVFFLVLEALGHRRRQDVEQEALGALLLGLQLPVRLFEFRLDLELFPDREPQQRIDHRRHGDEVEREEHHAGAQRHLLRARRAEVDQGVVDRAGKDHQRRPGEEPGDRLAHAEEEDGADRREQPPQDEAARVDEIADAPLHHEGREEEQAELRDAEEGKVARQDVDHHVRGQRDLEEIRVSDGKLRAEQPVDRQPDHRSHADEAGGEHQELLVEADFGAVLRFDAGVAQPFEKTPAG